MRRGRRRREHPSITGRPRVHEPSDRGALASHDGHRDGRRSHRAALVQTSPSADDRDVRTTAGPPERRRIADPANARARRRGGHGRQPGGHDESCAGDPACNRLSDAQGRSVARAAAQRDHDGERTARPRPLASPSLSESVVEDAVKRSQHLPLRRPRSRVRAHATVHDEVRAVGAQAQVVDAGHGHSDSSGRRDPRPCGAGIRIVDDEQSQRAVAQRGGGEGGQHGAEAPGRVAS